MSTLEKYLYAKGLSNSTVKTYHKATLEFLSWLDSQQIETENVRSVDVTAYMSFLQNKGLANVTRSIQLNIIRIFFEYLIQQNGHDSNPAQHIKIRGSKRRTLYPALSAKELDSLYQSYEMPTEDDTRANRNWFTYYRLSRQRNKTILGLMIWQAMTTPEISRLRLQDVKLREGTIYITGSRKSAERTLELKPQQIMELMEYRLKTREELLRFYPNGSGPDRFYISTPPAGRKVSTTKDKPLEIWKRLSQEMKTQNPRFINFKQVRTSVITHWLGQHNLRQVQHMAGHKYVSTTETYLVNQVEDLQADIEKFHPIA